MFIVLLVPYLVTAEWVEISQSYYRKEPQRNVIHITETSTENIYTNSSLSEYQWSKGYIDRIPGKIKMQHQRIQPDEWTTIKVDRNLSSKHKLNTSTLKTLDVKSNKVNSDNSIETTESYYKHNNFQTQRTQLNRDIQDANYKNKIITKAKDKKQNFDTESSNTENSRIKNTFKSNNLDFIHLSKTPQLKADNKFTQDPQQFIEENNSKENRKKIPKRDKNNASPNENTKKNSGLDTLIKFLKVVSQTIQKGTKKFNGKIKYLEDLKQSLMANIEERIDSVFPDDNENRRRRSSEAEARGHVEFPSSESALMTISFLTFAVFLIKLVLQVIHTYKAKTMMVTPAVVATVGRAGKVFR